MQERCPGLLCWPWDPVRATGNPQAPPGNIQHQVFRSMLAPKPWEQHQLQQTNPQLSGQLQDFGPSSCTLSGGRLEGTWAAWARGSGTWQERWRRQQQASEKGCRREGEGMKSKRRCRKGPKCGPKWWGAQSTSPPEEVLHRVRRRLCSSRQEALDPAELLQRSVHVNQLDRQRGEKQGG